MKTINSQVNSPSRRKMKKNYTRHIIIKFRNSSAKTLKAAGEKQEVTYRRTHVRIMVVFLLESTRRYHEASTKLTKLKSVKLRRVGENGKQR